MHMPELTPNVDWHRLREALYGQNDELCQCLSLLVAQNIDGPKTGVSPQVTVYGTWEQRARELHCTPIPTSQDYTPDSPRD
jgi:hypothetical protein